MKTDSFADLKEVINALKPEEIEVAKKFIVAFDSNITKNQSKSLKLFKVLVEHPNIDKDGARKMTSKNVNERSFDKLVLRLKDKVLESLTLDINTNRKGSYSELYKTVFDVRKKIMQAHIIFGRGMNKTAFKLYDKIIVKAKKYELYDELLEVLTYKQLDFGLRFGKKEFDKYSKEIAFYEQCKNSAYMARNWYYRHFIEEIDFTGVNSKNLEMLNHAIAELEEKYRLTQSANVGFYLYFLMMEHFLVQGDYEACVNTGHQLISLIENSPAVYTPMRLGNAYTDLADNELFLRHFDSAIKHAQVASEHFLPNSYNYEVAVETEFRAHFYNNDFDHSMAVISRLLEQSKPTRSPFQYSKRMYFKACVMFLMGEFKQSYQLLQSTREMEKDKEGWNIGIRILSILNHIELMLLDVADVEIESLRKHIERVREDRAVRPRERKILRILIQLEKNSFDFPRVKEKCQDDLDLLASDQKDYCWELKTHEMIAFHIWFQCKVDNTNYRLEFPDRLLDSGTVGGLTQSAFGQTS